LIGAGEIGSDLHMLKDGIHCAFLYMVGS